uniref:Reverse transcriptase domain-containing protein n=1 Tax=Panagrellus redivivus TaxID=6233 RepID=A0A7E4URR9_PANRE
MATAQTSFSIFVFLQTSIQLGREAIGYVESIAVVVKVPIEESIAMAEKRMNEYDNLLMTKR